VIAAFHPVLSMNCGHHTPNTQSDNEFICTGYSPVDGAAARLDDQDFNVLPTD
jgi:hypothetical protein